MNLEELKVIWDTQNKAPLYAVNEKGLHAIFRSKSEKLKRLIFWQEAQTYLSSLFVVTVIVALLVACIGGFLRELPTAWDVIALFAAAGGWIYFGASVFLERRRQRRRQRERAFSTSLRDEIDRDIAQLEFEIRSRNHVALGFIPPYVGGALLLLIYFRLTGAPLWFLIPIVAFMIGAFIWESRSQQRLAESNLKPKKRELESLREKLTNGES